MSDSSENGDTVDQEAQTGLIIPAQALPERLLLLPVYERPFFPSQVQPLVVDQDPWGETFEQLAKAKQQELGLCYVGDDEDALHDAAAFRRTGCVVRLHNVTSADGKIQFIAHGLQRFTIKRWIKTQTPYLIDADYPQETQAKKKDVKAYAMALIQAIKDCINSQ